VIPGEYRLSAIASTPDNAAGLMFAPSYIDVAIKSPLLNVEFSQLKKDQVDLLTPILLTAKVSLTFKCPALFLCCAHQG
ncbi:nodal modulator 1-like, partial [Trifolium medium]|nr:nodal modulator 1-like [Trifolium medium]